MESHRASTAQNPGASDAAGYPQGHLNNGAVYVRHRRSQITFAGLLRVDNPCPFNVPRQLLSAGFETMRGAQPGRGVLIGYARV